MRLDTVSSSNLFGTLFLTVEITTDIGGKLILYQKYQYEVFQLLLFTVKFYRMQLTLGLFHLDIRGRMKE